MQHPHIFIWLVMWNLDLHSCIWHVLFMALEKV